MKNFISGLLLGVIAASVSAAVRAADGESVLGPLAAPQSMPALEQEQQQVITEAQTKAQDEIRSRKARDGSGYGAGPGGERGLGKEDAPHHQQYGSPVRESAQ